MNKHNKPNIIFLIVDMLRQTKIGAAGYSPDITPNLNEIYLNGFRATQHFSNGNVTQFSFPSIFTSTLPLDFGGYNSGIKNRPDSFPEILSKNGYETWGAVTGHPCCAHFGYDRGFDKFENLIDLYQWFRQMFRVELRYLIDGYKQKKYTYDEFTDHLVINYSEYLKSTLRYIDEMEDLELPNNGWNRKKLRSSINNEIKIISEDPKLISEKILNYDQNFRDVLGLKKISKKIKIKIKFKNKIKNFLNKKVSLYSERRAFPAHYVNENFKKFIKNRNTSKPFFAYMHYFDVHEAKLLFSNFSSKKFLDIGMSLIKSSKRDFKKGGFVYDVAMYQVDREIGRLLKFLKQNKLDKDTIIVITGDHGTQSGYPKRTIVKENTDLSKNFFDEYHHVPLIISGGGIKSQETDEICSHLDLAPTLFDIIGIKSPRSFLGKSVYTKSTNHNKYVIGENNGNGNCDLKNKNIYMSVRSKKLKTVYEIKKFKIEEREVYNISKDKWEFENLKETDDFKDLRKEHFDIVNSRIKKIKLENNL